MDNIKHSNDGEINNRSIFNLINKYGFIGVEDFEYVRISPEISRKREIKWLHMLDNWNYYMSEHYNKVKRRCRKGIPSAVRPRAWQFLCGAHFLRDNNRQLYDELIHLPGNLQYLNDISNDIHRQFPQHEMFVDFHGLGQQDLFDILKAYSLLNPRDGYCQGQAPVAATLLMNMPAEQAFWCLVAICDKYLPGYYSRELEGIQLDGEILFGLLRKVDKAAYNHLEQKIGPLLYMTEWFMCIFSRTLPWGCVLRVWDMFLCEVGLLLLRITLSTTDNCKKYSTSHETLAALKSVGSTLKNEKAFLMQLETINITNADMEKEHWKQMKIYKSKK